MSSFFHYFWKDNFAEYIIISWQLISLLVQLLSCIWLFATPWTAAHQAPLSSTTSGSLLKFMSTELVMLSNHLILCCSFLLLPSGFVSIRVFFKELALLIRLPKYWSFSFSNSPSNEYSGLISLTPGCSVVKNPPANAGDAGSIPGSGRSPGEGNGNPLQYPCLGNPMDRGVELGLQVMESQKESDII